VALVANILRKTSVLATKEQHISVLEFKIAEAKAFSTAATDNPACGGQHLFHGLEALVCRQLDMGPIIKPCSTKAPVIDLKTQRFDQR
jgi:glycerol dehydrogenase-like iron-containing ADH family enzyme